MAALRTRTPVASDMSSVSWYASVNRPVPFSEMLFRQWILYMEFSF